MSDTEMMQLHTDSTFCGWTNWDTWNTNLWLISEESVYFTALDLPDGDELRLFFLDSFRVSHTAYGWVDDINPLLVNWQEIFDSLHEE